MDINRPFILYADCEIEYDGRACSKLVRGNYLILKKSDNSVQIHGGNKIPPRNYQGSNSKLEFVDNILVVQNKRETIKAIIYFIHSLSYPDNWSLSEIEINKTEADLVRKIIGYINDYVKDEVIKIETEYKTELGPIDIAVTGAAGLHLIEVKRNSISCSNVYQLIRYKDSASGVIKAYIAGPDIKKNALDLCVKHNIEYLKVVF